MHHRKHTKKENKILRVSLGFVMDDSGEDLELHFEEGKLIAPAAQMHLF